VSYRPITDMWILARCKYKGRKKRYGGYLGGFPERARALLGTTINDPVLHVCGGLARLYPYAGGFGPRDSTLDMDAMVSPDYQQDARDPLPDGFKAMLIDPPYSVEDAEQYAPGAGAYPSPAKLVQNAIDALDTGCRAGIIHYILPKCPQNARFVACVGVVSGFNNRIRVYSVFERK
jgi:hypothetical protein